jgi:hypothetical protein
VAVAGDSNQVSGVGGVAAAGTSNSGDRGLAAGGSLHAVGGSLPPRFGGDVGGTDDDEVKSSTNVRIGGTCVRADPRQRHGPLAPQRMPGPSHCALFFFRSTRGTARHYELDPLCRRIRGQHRSGGRGGHHGGPPQLDYDGSDEQPVLLTNRKAKAKKTSRTKSTESVSIQRKASSLKAFQRKLLGRTFALSIWPWRG